ncbi:MAG: SCP2 sterol-binding domain-containing protein [Acidobacteriota bacterium]
MSEEKKDFTVAEFTEAVRERLGNNAGLDAAIKIVFDDGAIVFIDGKSVPNSVSSSDSAADVTLRLSIATLNQLHRKELNPMMGVMSGKIKVEGNPMAAMKLDKLWS